MQKFQNWDTPFCLSAMKWTVVYYLLNIIIAGKVVSGYKVYRDSDGVDHWTLLGRRNPLTPQMFYPVFNKDPISYGDRLVCMQIIMIIRPFLTNFFRQRDVQC